VADGILWRPLLGQAGVGKTEVAKALAAVHGAELIRLQCYEGLDQNAALTSGTISASCRHQGAGSGGENADTIEEHIFRALPAGAAAARRSGELLPVLLVDEVDRADEEFEAFLLELSDFQVSTRARRRRPRSRVATSNGTRELSDAAPRCLYHYVDFPEVDREARISCAAARIDTALALQVARMVNAVRKEDLRKVPGVAETLDWAAVLAGRGTTCGRSPRPCTKR
jgi:MoxR-like ATPase